MWTIAGPWPLKTRWASARRAATAGTGMWVCTIPMSWERTSRRRRAIQATLVGVTSVEAVDGDAVVPDLVDERVLPRQQVGDLGPVAGRVEVAHRARDQPFGAAQSEALGQHQHADRVPIRTRLDPHAAPAATALVREVPAASNIGDRGRADLRQPDANSLSTSAHRSPTTPISKRSRHRRRAAAPIAPGSSRTRLQRRRQGGDVPRGDEQAGLAVGDDLRHRARRRRRRPAAR